MLVPTRAAIVALIALLVLPMVGGFARAAEPSVASLRAEADAIAGRYFDALARFQTLDRQITDNERAVAALSARVRRARVAARVRAASAYRSSSAQITSILQSHDALAASRRIQLIGDANERVQTVFARLRANTKALKTQRRALVADRKAQADALASLQEQSAAMESKLALAQQQERAALAVQFQPAPEVVQPTTTEPPAAEAPAAEVTTTTAPPTTTVPTTTTVPPPKVVTPPPNYVGTPGVYPMHDDPFLTCVRTRESGGNYSAVNPAGPYLGAYQFFQSTWNAAANHAGLTSLVGVPANVATQYDQDHVAWTLYQWQGAAPWGGGCP